MEARSKTHVQASKDNSHAREQVLSQINICTRDMVMQDDPESKAVVQDIQEDQVSTPNRSTELRAWIIDIVIATSFIVPDVVLHSTEFRSLFFLMLVVLSIARTSRGDSIRNRVAVSPSFKEKDEEDNFQMAVLFCLAADFQLLELQDTVRME